MAKTIREYFDWPSDFEGDLRLDHFRDQHDIFAVQWDEAVWWNPRLASNSRAEAGMGGDLIRQEVLNYLAGPNGEDLFMQMAARVPRSESRCADHIELAISHIMKSNIDIRGNPWMVYDPERGVWRMTGMTLQNGTPVAAVIDRLVEQFARAMHRAADFLYGLVDTVIPPIPNPGPNAPPPVIQAFQQNEAARRRLFAAVKQGHEMARSIPRGKYGPLKKLLHDRLGVVQTSWDSDTRWLVLRDGVINLRDVVLTREKTLLPFSPETMSTMALEVGLGDAVRNAGLSEWEAGIRKVLPNDEVRKYLQKRFGAALLGTPGEVDKSVIWQHGVGDTAKSTIQECIAGANGVFAPYSYAASSDVLMKRSNGNPAAERFIAYARGKRFVIMSEINAGEKLDREQFTRLTGGDTVDGTAKFANAVSYLFTATIFIASNDAPMYPPGDTVLTKRIHVVPFRHKLWQRTKNPVEWEAATEDHRADPQWKSRVLESNQERAAILHWVLDGLVLWSDEKLSSLPLEMLEASDEFSEGADPVKELVDALTGADADYTPLIRICTDAEWHEMGLVDGDGLTNKALMDAVVTRAREMDLVKFGDNKLSKSYENGVKKLLEEQGGKYKVASVRDASGEWRSARRWTRLWLLQNVSAPAF